MTLEHGAIVTKNLERSRKANWKHGHYSAEAKKERREAQIERSALKEMLKRLRPIGERSDWPRRRRLSGEFKQRLATQRLLTGWRRGKAEMRESLRSNVVRNGKVGANYRHRQATTRMSRWGPRADGPLWSSMSWKAAVHFERRRQFQCNSLGGRVAPQAEMRFLMEIQQMRPASAPRSEGGGRR